MGWTALTISGLTADARLFLTLRKENKERFKKQNLEVFCFLHLFSFYYSSGIITKIFCDFQGLFYLPVIYINKVCDWFTFF